eukprot:SAG31_NODE_8033_length_1536_cov_1.805150_1_plen_395_part_01
MRGGRYSYAWDVIEQKSNTEVVRYMFYCGNHDGDFVIRDSIMFRKGTRQADGEWVFGEERLALPHGSGDRYHSPLPPRGCANVPRPSGICIWDKQHACDPDVVAAAGWPKVGFGLGDEQYQFALFYNGIHQDSASGPGFPPGRPFHPVEANHIGVAVAQSLEGPWHKKNGPVIIGDEWWGVGQVSAMAVSGSQVLLTYTRGNSSAFNGQMRMVLDLGNVSNPVVVERERPITDKGLTQANGVAGSGGFVNAAMLYDPFLARFWTLREGKPMPHTDPLCFVSSSVQLAWIPAAAILPSMPGVHDDEHRANYITSDHDFEWTVEPGSDDLSISPALSNRTHNPGFVSDAFGHRMDPTTMEGVLTSMGSLHGSECLWSYRPFAVTWRGSNGSYATRN